MTGSRENLASTGGGTSVLFSFPSVVQCCSQPRSQGLSSLPPLVVATKTLVAAGHVTSQNLGGRKICWKGGVFYRHLDQMYLSTHPPCGLGWIDGHVSRVSVPTIEMYPIIFLILTDDSLISKIA